MATGGCEQEEWEYLEEWQKELHKNVMWENYEALSSLGFQVARPVVLLKTEQQVDPHSADSLVVAEARIPNSIYIDSCTSNSRTFPGIPSTGTDFLDTNINTYKKPASSNFAATNSAPAPTATKSRAFGTSSYVTTTLGSVFNISHKIIQISEGVSDTITTVNGASTAFTRATSDATKYFNETVEKSISTGETPRKNSRGLSPSTTFSESQWTSGKGNYPGAELVEVSPQNNFVEKSRTPVNSVDMQSSHENFVEESRTSRIACVERIHPSRNISLGERRAEEMFPTWNILEERGILRQSAEEDRTPRNSKENMTKRNSLVNKWTHAVPSVTRPKRRGHTTSALRLVLLQQKKIMRELQDLRQSNKQIEHSIVQIMEEIRRKPEKTAADFLPSQEAYLEMNGSLIEPEIPFIPCLDLQTSSQHGPAWSTKGVQQASNSFNDSPACASTQRLPPVMSIPEPILEDIKEEPDPVMEQSVLLAPISAPLRAPRRETHGESLPDIPLACMTPEREAILLRHSRGEPHTLAKFLFQQHVPFHVYESWVHTTNFDGSRNKRAIPRNLRAEIMRFISSRFYLGEEDKKQIRDRINELLRMPRTGGWPVLN
ncbi:uncharacterized protein [Ambystoma mexicanum]|uniref:uncharacterized protein isoform X2 n=1 Tax=Ambystoma mexicanum TaxID=8296 RepID=UPI0037E95593